jgi:DNA-binding NarL/FixJ family response regulator
MRTTDRARILVVDDHALVRRGLAALIEREPDLVVCAEAESRATALAALAEHRPDLGLMDLRLPEHGQVDARHGLALVRELRRLDARLAILVLSFHDEPAYVEAARSAGAGGYLTKARAAEELVTAIRAVLAAAPQPQS